MAFLLRVLETKSRWDKQLPWLETGSLVADVFKCLRTTDGSLSTYEIADDQSNLNRVIAAFACTRDKFRNVDYVLLPMESLIDSFTVTPTPGDTADSSVNEWHHDIGELTAANLLELVHVVNSCKTYMKRIPKKLVEKQVRKYLHDGSIDADKVNPGLRDKLSIGLKQ